MSRRNAVDVCFLFEQAPCRCGKAPKPEKPARQPRKRAAKPEPAESKCGWCTDEERRAGMPCACEPNIAPVAPAEPHPLDNPQPIKASARDAMRALAARSRATRRPEAAPDPVMDDAIRALEPILSRDEQTRYRAVLTRPRATGVRAMAWKQRMVDRRGESTK